jgi:hypothetical protein
MRSNTCAFCHRPLSPHAWKGADRRDYCGEFCASDAEEAPPIAAAAMPPAEAEAAAVA